MNKDSRLLRIGVLGLRAHRTVRAFRRLPQGAQRRTVRHLRRGRGSAGPRWRPIHEPRVTYRRFDEMLADPQVEAVIIGDGRSIPRAAGLSGDRSGKARAGRKAAGGQYRRMRGAARAGSQDRGLSFRSATIAGSIRASPSPSEFLDEEVGQRMGFKAWYYDSTFRYTMTDNLPAHCRSSSRKIRRPEGQPQAGQAAATAADARQPSG